MRHKEAKNPIISELIAEQLKNLSYLVENFFKLRLQIIIKSIFNNKFLRKDSLCMEELKILNSATQLLESYLKNIKNISEGLTPQEITLDELTGDFFLIRFLKNVPQIIGADLKKYGPFLIDDIAILPKKEVETLLKREAVILILSN